MASQARACLSVATHWLRLLREMSARQNEQFAHLASNVASVQASLYREIADVDTVTSAITRWMQKQQAQIDKTLAELLEEVAALQSASVSFVVSKMRAQTRPCQSPQDQHALRHTRRQP